MPKLLPDETLQEIWAQKNWRPSEEDRLIYLHDQGFTKRDIALQFPSKTVISIQRKLTELHHRIPGLSRLVQCRATEADYTALRTALEPYTIITKRLRKGSLDPVCGAFPQFSRKTIADVLSRLRRKRNKEAETTLSNNRNVRVKEE